MPVPDAIPVTTPVADMVPVAPGEKLHAPPVVRSVNIVVVPGHIWFSVVVIGNGELFTVIVLVAMQPPAPV